MRPFKCDACNRQWDRDGMSLDYLREIVGDHLWAEHGIRREDQGDLLPMTDEQIAWVRAQRSDPVTPQDLDVHG